MGAGKPPGKASLFNGAGIGIWETYDGVAVWKDSGLGTISIVKRGTVRIVMDDGKTIYTLILN